MKKLELRDEQSEEEGFRSKDASGRLNQEKVKIEVLLRMTEKFDELFGCCYVGSYRV